MVEKHYPKITNLSGQTEEMMDDDEQPSTSTGKHASSSPTHPKSLPPVSYPSFSFNSDQVLFSISAKCSP